MTMYAKLFSSILDSSVWLEAPTTRLVWLTLLAAKDQDGFARFATVENLAARARISIPEAEQAVTILEAPDENSSNPDNDGRRIERVPGGWMVLNAKLYDAIAKREQERAEVRERVRKHRAAKSPSVATDDPAPSTARERLLAAAGPRRAAFAGIMHRMQDGADGVPFKATDDQMEQACADYLVGMGEKPNAAHFRGFVKRTIESATRPQSAEGDGNPFAAAHRRSTAQ